MERNDVTPPGREKQVQALKEKPGIDNPWAVAWASYNDEAGDGPTWMGARCDACGQIVPMVEDRYDTHLAAVRDMEPSKLEPIGHGDRAESRDLCPGGGATVSNIDHIEQRGGKWVLLAKSTGKVLGTHATKAEAEEQERAVQASKHADSPDRVRRFEHHDFASNLPRPVKTADGFWAVSGHVARTGVQEYRDSKGGIRRELRLPEDVSASLPSFALQPLTNDHPPEMVDPHNAEKYVAGAVGEAKMDGGWVVAPLKIYTADAIAAVEAGRVQLSVGYSCRLDFVGGDWQGQRYDAIQRDIVVNHVALVDSARAGSAARLRLDGNDAISIACDTSRAAPSTSENKSMAQIKLDGMTFEVADANAPAAVDRAIAAARKDGEDKASAAEQAKKNAEAMLVSVTKERDALQGRLDGKLAEEKAPVRVLGREIAVVDAVDQTKMDAFVTPLIEERAAARAALLVEARKHLGANEKFDSHKSKDGKDIPAKSDTEIKRLVVQKLEPSAKMDGKSDEYVQARYDAAIEAAAKRVPSSIEVARAAVTGTAIVVENADAAAAPMDPEAARRAMIERQLRANVNHPKRIDGKV
jgi:hypothetical protein